MDYTESMAAGGGAGAAQDNGYGMGEYDYYDKDCPDFNYKLILVGSARVGKTSVTNRFMNDQFNEQEKSTKTVQISRKMVKIEHTQNKWTQLHVWDTLGQEKFKSLAPLFFRKAIGAFLVYDVTNRESFESLDGWFQQLSNNIDSRVIIMLIGNKCDMPNREVPYNVAMEYARARNFGFLEVSAKTGMNVRNAFNCLVREIYRNTNGFIEEQPIQQEPKESKEQPKKKDRIVTGQDLRMSSIGRSGGSTSTHAAALEALKLKGSIVGKEGKKLGTGRGGESGGKKCEC